MALFTESQAEQKQWEQALKLAELIKELADLASSMKYLADDQGLDPENSYILQEAIAKLGPVLAVMVAQEEDIENE